MRSRDGSTGKDNTDHPLKPIDRGRSGHLPKGTISQKNQVRLGPGSALLQPATPQMHQKIHPEKQRESHTDDRDRNFSRDHQLGKVMRGDSKNQNVLGDHFRDAKSRSNDTPAEKSRDDPSRGRDR